MKAHTGSSTLAMTKLRDLLCGLPPVIRLQVLPRVVILVHRASTDLCMPIAIPVKLKRLARLADRNDSDCLLRGAVEARMQAFA